MSPEMFDLKNLLPGKITIYANVGDGYTTLIKDICYNIHKVHPISSAVCESFGSVVGDDVSRDFMNRCGRFIHRSCLIKIHSQHHKCDLYLSDSASNKNIDSKFSIRVSKNQRDFTDADYIFILKNLNPQQSISKDTNLQSLWSKHFGTTISSKTKFFTLINDLPQFTCLVLDKNRNRVYMYKSKTPLPIFRIVPKVGLATSHAHNAFSDIDIFST
jgi:hypothetical protein